MSKQCLDISQMQHLKDLGVDTSKASMSLIYTDKYGDIVDWDIVDKEIHEEDIGRYNPYLRKKYGTFTLQDILDLLPTNISIYDLSIIKRKNNSHNFYEASFSCFNGQYLYLTIEDEVIDATYNMLCWCIENGYIETNKKE